MTIFQNLLDFILHIDTHLVVLTNHLGISTYFILFLIIFIETGLIIVPFLPGSSLLLASGALAAKGAFSLSMLLFVLCIAAVMGYMLNYYIGMKIGNEITSTRYVGKVVTEEKMNVVRDFLDRNGKKTLLISRFIPLIRLFTPFVAGASRMNYRFFFILNIIGAIIWVGVCTILGFFFGNIPVIRNNFGLLMLLVVILSVLPTGIGMMQRRFKQA